MNYPTAAPQKSEIEVFQAALNEATSKPEVYQLYLNVVTDATMAKEIYALGRNYKPENRPRNWLPGKKPFGPSLLNIKKVDQNGKMMRWLEDHDSQWVYSKNGTKPTHYPEINHMLLEQKLEAVNKFISSDLYRNLPGEDFLAQKNPGMVMNKPRNLPVMENRPLMVNMPRNKQVMPNAALMPRKRGALTLVNKKGGKRHTRRNKKY